MAVIAKATPATFRVTVRMTWNRKHITWCITQKNISEYNLHTIQLYLFTFCHNKTDFVIFRQLQLCWSCKKCFRPILSWCTSPLLVLPSVWIPDIEDSTGPSSFLCNPFRWDYLHSTFPTAQSNHNLQSLWKRKDSIGDKHLWCSDAVQWTTLPCCFSK